MNGSRIALAVVGYACGFATASAAQRSGTPRDTVDVAVGSPLVNTSGVVPHRARTLMSRTTNGVAASGPEFFWTFAFPDSAGVSYFHIESAMGGQLNTVFMLDRKTLAPLRINGAAPPLPAPAFLGGLADLLVEALPRRIGTVYRANIWRRGMSNVETHLFETTSREDITVLGHAHKQAWVVEDRSADGATLFGRMWLVGVAPYLVRWTINNPDGSVTQLDQELAKEATP